MSTLPASALTNVAVMLDGNRIGDIRAVDGLDFIADIAANDLGPDNVSKKHVANIGWRPGRLTIGLGCGTGMAAWLHNSFAGAFPAHSGAIVIADANSRAQSAVNFQNARLTRCTLPVLDVSSKDPAALVIEFSAEQLRMIKGDGSDIRGRIPPSKPWLCSGFRIKIGALPCANVLRVDALDWTSTVAADQIGIFREPAQLSAKITVPDLTLTIAASDWQAWADAAKAWFVDGSHLEANEMKGVLTLLAPDNSMLARIGLNNLGFKNFQTLSAASSRPDQFMVQLYVESMSFDITG